MKILIVFITIAQIFLNSSNYTNTNRYSILEANYIKQCDTLYILKVIVENNYNKLFKYSITIDGTDGSSFNDKFSSINSTYSISLKFGVDYFVCVTSVYHLVYKFRLYNNTGEQYVEKKIVLKELHNPDLKVINDTSNNYFYFGNDSIND